MRYEVGRYGSVKKIRKGERKLIAHDYQVCAAVLAAFTLICPIVWGASEKQTECSTEGIFQQGM
jgi:hypothetical protein